MNCGSGCGSPCGDASVVKVGKWWWTLRVVPKDGNEGFFSEINKITPDDAKKMGQDGLDKFMKTLPKLNVLEIDFVDQKPDPGPIEVGLFVYYKNKQRFEIRDYHSVEKIQSALCTDPNCKDPSCLSYQKEIKEKQAKGLLHIVH